MTADSHPLTLSRRNTPFVDNELFAHDDPLKLMIEGYRTYYATEWFDEVSKLNGMQNFVYGHNEFTKDDKIIQSVHGHQRRIPKTILDEAVDNFNTAFNNVSLDQFVNFEDLFSFMKKAAPSGGFQQVCVYDTALRQVFSFNHKQSDKYKRLEPRALVYLHCGALKGAQALWHIDTLLRIYKKRKALKPLNRPSAVCTDFPRFDCTKPLDFFCKELQALGSYHLENFLCVYHNRLTAYYLALAKKLTL